GSSPAASSPCNVRRTLELHGFVRREWTPPSPERGKRAPSDGPHLSSLRHHPLRGSLPMLSNPGAGLTSRWVFSILLPLVPLFASVNGAAPSPSSTLPDRAALAAQVRAEFLHAWRAYEHHAWGHDELKPLSRTAHDWHGQSLLMTPVDALDTLILMGLSNDAEKARRLIVEELSFDKDISVKNFEVTIRLLGGLLSGYQMTGDGRLLRLAEDLGTRLLPVFDSPTGMPYRFVNLRTGEVHGSRSNPAEIGTLILEFGTLARLTKK